MWVALIATHLLLSRQFDENAKRAADAAERAQQQANAAWHAAERKAAEFRFQHQQPQSRREWDINRPDALRQSHPARSGDNDPRCGPSSLQKFQGEDLNARQRQAENDAKDRAYWNAQRSYHAAAVGAEAAATAAADVWSQRQNEMQIAAAAADSMSTRQAGQQVAAENSRAAAIAATAEAAQRYVDAAADAAEAAAIATSAVLNEERTTGISSADPNRVRPDHWKGMSTAERAAYPLRQLQQIEEKAALHQEEAAAAKRYSELQAAAVRTIDEQEQTMALQRKLEVLQARRYQELQAAEKVAKDAMLRQLYGNNAPKQEYFAQFQSSHR